MLALLLADVLPVPRNFEFSPDPEPYIAVVGIGFMIGVLGHIASSIKGLGRPAPADQGDGAAAGLALSKSESRLGGRKGPPSPDDGPVFTTP